MSPQRKRGRPVAVTPEEVVDRAVALFCAEGVAAHSLNQVCASLGISKPALYRAFGGEDGLRRAALAHYFHVWMRPSFGQMDFTQPFARQCEQLADLVCFPDPQSPQTKGCLYARMRLSRDSLEPQSLGLVEELERNMNAQFTAWMEGVAQSGQLKPDLSVAAAAAFLDAQMTLAVMSLTQGHAPSAVRDRLLLALSALRP